MHGLRGHAALVTGGTRGIGKAIALRLAAEGADVGVVGLRGDGREAAEEIRALGVRVVAVKGDVSDAAAVKAMVEEVSSAIGPVDILVNNAGISDRGYCSVWELGEQSWDRMCAVNLKGVFLCCREAVPGMLKKGWGRIVNISSTSGITGGTSGAHYAASKGGVIALSKALASELAPLGITVNVVAPSKIDTDMFRDVNPGERREQTIKRIPVGRLGSPEDVAEAVAYFAGGRAGYTTGQVLVVSGGY
jgi:NAD(P)-dependent dehydrogenase (short-subunit alcohol dehydrogenase family)